MTADITTGPRRAATWTIPTTLDDGTIGRLNAWFFDTFDPVINEISRQNVAAARLVEVRSDRLN